MDTVHSGKCREGDDGRLRQILNIRVPFSLRTGTAPAVDLIRLESLIDIFGYCDQRQVQSMYPGDFSSLVRPQMPRPLPRFLKVLYLVVIRSIR